MKTNILGAAILSLFLLSVLKPCSGEPARYSTIGDLKCWLLPHTGLGFKLTCVSPTEEDPFTFTIDADELRIYEGTLQFGTPPSTTSTSPPKLSLDSWAARTSQKPATATNFSKPLHENKPLAVASVASGPNNKPLNEVIDLSDQHNKPLNVIPSSTLQIEPYTGFISSILFTVTPAAYNKVDNINVMLDSGLQNNGSSPIYSIALPEQLKGRSSNGTRLDSSRRADLGKCCCDEISVTRQTQNMMREQGLLDDVPATEMQVVNFPAELRTSECRESVCGRTATTVTHCEQVIAVSNVTIEYSGKDSNAVHELRWEAGCTCSLQIIPDQSWTSNSGSTKSQVSGSNIGHVSNFLSTNSLNDQSLRTPIGEKLKTASLLIKKLITSKSTSIATGSTSITATLAVPVSFKTIIPTGSERNRENSEETSTKVVADEGRLEKVAKMINRSLGSLISVITAMFSKIGENNKIENATGLASKLDETAEVIGEAADELLEINKNVSGVYLSPSNISDFFIKSRLESTLNQSFSGCTSTVTETIRVESCSSVPFVFVTTQTTLPKSPVVFIDGPSTSQYTDLPPGFDHKFSEDFSGSQTALRSTVSSSVSTDYFRSTTVSVIKATKVQELSSTLTPEIRVISEIKDITSAYSQVTTDPRLSTPLFPRPSEIQTDFVYTFSSSVYSDKVSESEYSNILSPSDLSSGSSETTTVSEETVVNVVYIVGHRTYTSQWLQTSFIVPGETSRPIESTSIGTIDEITTESSIVIPKIPGSSASTLQPSFEPVTSKYSETYAMVTPVIPDTVSLEFTTANHSEFTQPSLISTQFTSTTESQNLITTGIYSIPETSPNITGKLDQIEDVTTEPTPKTTIDESVYTEKVPSASSNQTTEHEEGKTNKTASELVALKLTLDQWCVGNVSSPRVEFENPDDFLSQPIREQYSLMIVWRKFAATNIINDLESFMLSECKRELRHSLPLSRISGSISGSMKSLPDMSGLSLAVIEFAHCVNRRNGCNALVDDTLSRRLSAAQYVGSLLNKHGICAGRNQTYIQHLVSEISLINKFEQAVEWSRNKSCSDKEASEESIAILLDYQEKFQPLVSSLKEICLLQSSLDNSDDDDEISEVSGVGTKKIAPIGSLITLDTVLKEKSESQKFNLPEASVHPPTKSSLIYTTNHVTIFPAVPTLTGVSRVTQTPNLAMPSESLFENLKESTSTFVNDIIVGATSTESTGTSNESTSTFVNDKVDGATSTIVSTSSRSTSDIASTTSTFANAAVSPVTPFDGSRIQNSIIDVSPDKLRVNIFRDIFRSKILTETKI